MDHMNAYEKILRLLHSGESLAERMRQLTPPRLALPRLDYEGERTELCRWLRRLLRHEPPPQDIAGVWLGLFHPVGPGGDRLTDMYFSATASFDQDDIDKAWASGPCYFPAGRYAGSSVLANLQRCGDASKVDPQHMCLGFLAFVAGPLLDSVHDLLPDGLGVAVGWDAGDALYLGSLRSGAFHPRDPAEILKAHQEGSEDLQAWLATPDDDPASDDPAEIRAWARRRREAWLEFRRQRAKDRRARGEA